MEVKDIRYEKKYIYSEKANFNFLNLKLLNLNLKEQYKIRKINNIYFDNLNYKNYNDNIEGFGKRQKIRLRWYNDDKIFYLELKSKLNHLVEKKTVKIDNLNFIKIDNELSKEIFYKLKTQGIFFKSILNLKPVSFNSYKRSYYKCPDTTFRLTVDKDLKFSKIINSNLFKTHKLNHLKILELKYQINDDYKIKYLLSNFRNNLSKYSKYINSFTKNY